MPRIRDVLDPTSGDKLSDIDKKPRKEVPTPDQPTVQIVPAEEKKREVDPEDKREIIGGILEKGQVKWPTEKGDKRGRYKNLPS